MTNNLELEKFKRLLTKERKRLEAERESVARDTDLSDDELSNYDNHPAEAATLTYERGRNSAIRENFDDIIEQIDEALRKIEDGSYGLCDRCKTQINPSRLKAIPYATMCIDCQGTIETR